MTNYQLHNDCKVLSGYVYKEKKPKTMNGWAYSKSSQGTNGFYAEVYKKDNNIMIVVKGTDMERGKKEFFKDLDDDLQMSTMRTLPGQLKNARELYNEYAKSYPNAHIILTGHSLGGSVMQALGAETGAETVTFGAYGIASTHNTNFKYTDNITNYGNAQDAIFVSNIDFQLGKTVILNSNANEGDSFGTNIQKPQKDPHLLENFGNLEKGVEYKREIFENKNAPIFKIGIEYDSYNPEEVFDTQNRILYKGEIDPLDLDEKSPLYDLYMDQWIDKKPMPTKEELDKRTRIGELIYVENYTRSDGTKVSGYYRACPR